jgi:hypothetical protein
MNRRYKTALWAFGIIAASALFLWIAVRVVNLHTYQNSDFFSFWLSGRMVLGGQNPYQADAWLTGHVVYGSTWLPNQTYPYPLPHAIFFAPLSLLPLYEAFVTWVFLSEWFILGGLVLVLRCYPEKLRYPYFIPLAAGLAIFRPTIVQMINGQFAAFMFLVLAGVIALWQKEKWWQGGILLSFVALKPNIGVPIIGLIIFYLLSRRRMKAVVAIAFSGVTMLIAGCLVNPGWVLEFLNSGGAKFMQTFGYAPSIWGLSSIVCGGGQKCLIGLGSISTICLLVGFSLLIIWRKKEITNAQVVSLSATLALLLTTHVWPYDQLLLALPVVFATMEFAERGRRFIQNAMMIFMIDLLAVVLFVFNMKAQNEIASAFLTIAVLGLIVFWIFHHLENENVNRHDGMASHPAAPDSSTFKNI